MRASTQRLVEAQFIRNPVLPGAELRVVSGHREWGFFSQDYQILFSDGWCGSAWYQRNEFILTPRSVVIAAPNQLIVTKKSTPGTLMCLTVEKSLTERLLEGAAIGVFGFGHHTLGQPTSGETATAMLTSLVHALSFTYCPEGLEAQLKALATAVAERAIPSAPSVSQQGRQTNNPFGDEADLAFDLRSLSEQLGTSRFSALRAFKRHFGLPPHTYQLHLRVEQAQTYLRAGHSPARVAIDCGFFDQSHLTRHFRRVLGTTPAQYARTSVSAFCHALQQWDTAREPSAHVGHR